MAYGDAGLSPGGSGATAVREVSYSYEVAERADLGSADDSGVEVAGEQVVALSDVTIEVPAGRTTAVVGPTGSGKSTLTNVVLRLVDPSGGVVEIDGRDLRTVQRGGIPSVATLVAQQTFLFDDSVRGNVTLGQEVDDADLADALEIAQADGFVAELPDGIDTRVGERGASLSGGQRQRVALARAVIRRPQLLVLDDATSAVDPAIETAILDGLRERSQGMTVLVVAYRMSTISMADRVAYLERGHVIDQGTHTELMGRCEGYQRLVTAYTREAQERAAVAADEETA